MTPNYFSPSKYVVTFDPNGGKVTTATKTVPSASFLGRLPTPERISNYRFVGWYTAVDGGIRVHEDTIIDNNVTFFTRWEYAPPRYPQHILTPPKMR